MRCFEATNEDTDRLCPQKVVSTRDGRQIVRNLIPNGVLDS